MYKHKNIDRSKLRQAVKDIMRNCPGVWFSSEDIRTRLAITHNSTEYEVSLVDTMLQQLKSDSNRWKFRTINSIEYYMYK